MSSVTKHVIIESISERIVHYINDFVKRDCNGCIINHPSQRQHSCLGFDQDLDGIELYYDDVYHEKRELILQSIQDSLNVEKKNIDDIYCKEKPTIYLRVKALYHSQYN